MTPPNGSYVKCPVCGEAHAPGPVGEPGAFFCGIEIKTCPNLPKDCVSINGRIVRFHDSELPT